MYLNYIVYHDRNTEFIYCIIDFWYSNIILCQTIVVSIWRRLATYFSMCFPTFVNWSIVLMYILTPINWCSLFFVQIKWAVRLKLLIIIPILIWCCEIICFAVFWNQNHLRDQIRWDVQNLTLHVYSNWHFFFIHFSYL